MEKDKGEGKGGENSPNWLIFAICTNFSDKRLQCYECLVGLEEMGYTETRRGWTKEQESYFAKIQFLSFMSKDL